MSTTHRRPTVADAFADLMNGHDPDAVDGFVAADYINHNAFVDDGREANRAFWTRGSRHSRTRRSASTMSWSTGIALPVDSPTTPRSRGPSWGYHRRDAVW